MKYGKRERIIGAVVLVALAVIFLPILFDKPDSDSGGPEPTLTIEQPINMPDDQSVPAPQPPEATQGIDSGVNAGLAEGEPAPDNTEDMPPPDAIPSEPVLPDDEDRTEAATSSPQATSSAQTSSSRQTPAPTRSKPAPADKESAAAKARHSAENDPILEAARKGSDGTGNPPSAVSDGGWAVQSGSFSNPEYAKGLADKLKGNHFPVYTLARNNLTVVLVGPYDSSESAEKASTQLQQQANIKGLVVRRKDDE